MNPKLKAGGILLIVFALGFMAGLASVQIRDERPTRFIGPGLDPFRREAGVIEHIEKRLTNIYDLTAEQQAGISKILKDSQKKYDAFFQETRPTFEQIRRAQQEAIRELMTPEQQKKFEAWLEERRKRREARGEGRGPGGPGGHHRGPPPPHDPPPGDSSSGEGN